jgi:hypothetical protein
MGEGHVLAAFTCGSPNAAPQASPSPPQHTTAQTLPTHTRTCLHTQLCLLCERAPAPGLSRLEHMLCRQDVGAMARALEGGLRSVWEDSEAADFAAQRLAAHV